MPDELLPCPFCGGTKFVVYNGKYGCMNGMCACEASIENWNRRAIPPNVARVIEEIGLIVGKFPGWEPESLKLQPAMVPVHQLQDWLKLLRGDHAG